LAIDGGFTVPALALDAAAAGLSTNLAALTVDQHLPLRTLATAACIAHLAALAIAAAAASVRVRNDGAIARFALGGDIAKLTQGAAGIAQAVLATIRAVSVALAFDAARTVATAGRTPSTARFHAADRRAVAIELRFAIVRDTASIVADARSAGSKTALAARDALLTGGAAAGVARCKDALSDAPGNVAGLASAVARFCAADAIDTGKARFARGRGWPAWFADLQEAALAEVLPATFCAHAAAVLSAKLAFSSAVARAATLRSRDVSLTNGSGLAGHVLAAKANGGLGVAADPGRASVGAVGRLEHFSGAALFDGAVTPNVRSLALHATRAVGAARETNSTTGGATDGRA
jgi:hypothetical protein